MPQAAVIATALTTQAAHPFGLFLNGGDVIGSVPIESIDVDEQGSGGVSSMSFVLDDPSAATSIPDGSHVEFWNLGGDYIIFRGYVDHVAPVPAFGGQGRMFEVYCTGVEAWLDWITIGSQVVSPTIGSGNNLSEMTAWIASQYAPMLYAPATANGVAPMTAMGNATWPIGFALTDGATSLRRIAISVVTPWSAIYTYTFTNASLRSVLDRLILDSGAYEASQGNTVSPVWYTIDFMMRLRMFADVAGLQPDDYTTLTVTDTYAGVPAAAGLEHAIEYGDVTHEVFVTGSNAASSGYFGDGTGLRGRQGVVTDTTIANLDAAAAAARSFFSTQQTVRRGSFTLEDFTPTATVHAGSLLTLTDTATGATGTYRIASIGKTFNASGRQNWKVTYGRVPPSVTQLTRRLTRTTPF